MKRICLLACFLILAISSNAAPSAPLMLKNDQVEFQFSPQNPTVIQQIHLLENGEMLRPLRNRGLVLKTLSVEEHAAQSMSFHQLQLNKSQADVSGDSMTVKASARNLEVNVKYSLPQNRSYLRQTVSVTNSSSESLVLAAVQPIGFAIPAPLYHRVEVQEWGFPVYVAGEKSGLVLSLDFPGAHAFSDHEAIRMDYRPMVKLEPGGTYDAFPSAIVAVASGDAHQARMAFHEYLRDQAPPREHFPVAFCTWGPWMPWANDALAKATIPLLPPHGSDLYLVDGGWLSWPKYNQLIGNGPFSPEIAEAAVDRRHYPEGMRPIREAADKAGVGFGLHFDVARNNSHVKSPLARPNREAWFDVAGDYFDLASEAGDRLRDFIAYWVEEYKLEEIKLDFYWPNLMPGEGFRHYANGYDALDQQMLKMIEVIETSKKVNPDLYVSLASGNGFYSPYWAYWAEQVHTVDPGLEAVFSDRFGEQPIYRTLAVSRRSAWFDRYWDKWFPPHMIKMDIGSHAYQQQTPAAIHPDDEPFIISEGIDWEHTLFSTIASGRIRDLRTNPLAMHPDELAFAKKWFEWADQNKELLNKTQPLKSPTGTDSTDLYLQVDGAKGLLWALPGFGESTEWVEVKLGREQGVPEGSAKLTYRIIYPFESQAVSVERSQDGQFTFKVPGPRRCAAVISELSWEDNAVKPDGAPPEEFVKAMQKVGYGYPCHADIDLNALAASWRNQPPMVMTLGKSQAFHTHRDEALLKVTRNYVEALAGGIGQAPESVISDLPAGNLVLVGHAQQDNVTTAEGAPRFAETFGVPVVELPSGEQFASGVLMAYPHPKDPASTVLVIAGRTPDETALALRTLQEQMADGRDSQSLRIGALSLSKPTALDLELNATGEEQPYLVINPTLAANGTPEYWKVGPVNLTVVLEYGDGERVTALSEQIVPFIWRDTHPLVLPATRYIPLRSRDGRFPQRAHFSVEAAKERSMVAPRLGEVELVKF